MAQGDIGGALSEVHALLSSAQAGARVDAADGPGDSDELIAADAAIGNFDSALSPRRVELTIHQVLAAAGDPRAAPWLQRAHRALMDQADAINDAALRQVFLANIPHRRDIVALWEGRGAQQ